MEKITFALIGLVAALHLGFLVLEMFLWSSDPVQKGLPKDLTNEQLTAKLAANMGLYNGFLAAGLVWSLLASQESFWIKVFFLSCAIVAGIFGGLTVKRSIVFFQAVPASLALIFIWLESHSIGLP
jgi:putative membrane protein